MKTPMEAALYRAVATSLLTLLVTGLTAYGQTKDIAQTIIITASAAIAVLGGRGVVEGNIDSVRAARAASGELGAISEADVGAYSPPINARPAGPLYQTAPPPYRAPRGYQSPPQVGPHPLDRTGGG